MIRFSAQSRNDYRMLLNSYVQPFIVNGQMYLSGEHLYQSYKTPDPLERTKIINTLNPADAWAAGRAVEFRPDWDNLRVKYMRKTIDQRLTAIPQLKALLMSTGEEELTVETDDCDKFWYVCICERCGVIGQNMYGQLLMELRSAWRS